MTTNAPADPAPADPAPQRLPGSGSEPSATSDDDELAGPLAELSAQAVTAFRGVQERVFGGDPAANARLTVEVVEAAAVCGVPSLVLITPWTINGLIFPSGDGPPELVIAGTARRVFRGELAPLGVYWSVNLVPDVSRLSNPRQARTLAGSFAAPFREAVRGWLGPAAR